MTHDPRVLGQIGDFRGLHPYRVIALFEDLAEAKSWIENAGDGGARDVQFI